jgi:hypothetical protein
LRSRSIVILYAFFAFFFVCISSAQTSSGSTQGAITDSAGTVAGTAAPAADQGAVNLTALVNALLKKGVLTPSEVDALRVAAPESQLQLLVQVLTRKGVLTAADLSAAAVPAATPAPALQPQTTPAPQPEVAQSQPAAVPPVAAIDPQRTVAFDSPQSGALAGLKIGPVTFAPYGFIKATGEQDSSSPNGDDFPIPGGLMLLPGSNTGPNADPEFHMKARQSLIGLNLEWPSISPKMTLTGRLEADFEGNFSESDNADFTSIGSPNLRLRLAWVRVDYRSTEKTSLFFVGGQDWTLFGSKALPNMLDTTWNAASYGAAYNRTPQFRFGVIQKLSDSERNYKLLPEFAIMMPSSGQVEKITFCTLTALYCPPGVSPTTGFLSQVGEAERQGADSDRPELEAGLTLQFQLDKAPAVAPAQIFWSGFYGHRTSIESITAEDLIGDAYPTALLAGTPLAKGYTASSAMYGNNVAAQLPTRWFTFVLSGYRGADLRQVLSGQLTTNYTNTTGLFPIPLVNVNGGTPAPFFLGTGVDNVAGTLSGFALLGCKVNPGAGTCPSSDVVVAPEHGVRAYGAFAELGLPLSRWFNANPKGYNAGWELYLHAGKDQLVHRDAAMQLGLLDGAGPNMLGQGMGMPMIESRFIGATLYYRINQWATFGVEPTHYSSRAIPELGNFWIIAGVPSRIWQDQRVEFGPVFTFGGNAAPPLPAQSPLTYSCSVNPSSVFSGEPIAGWGTALNLDPAKTAVYIWFVDGGTVTGVYGTAKIDTTNLAAGAYTLKGHVSQGDKPGENADCTAPYAVRVYGPPRVSCTANPSTVLSGDPSTITAIGVSPQNRPLTYSYSTTSGTVSGSGTTAILSTPGAPVGVAAITCSVADDKGQTASGTTTVTIAVPVAAPAPTTSNLCWIHFDRDPRRPVRVDNEGKACLDEIALNLQRSSDAKLVLVGNASSEEKGGKKLAADRAVNTKAYLVSEKGIDSSRIAVYTGSQDEKTVSTTLIPPGATFDAAGDTPVN